MTNETAQSNNPTEEQVLSSERPDARVLIITPEQELRELLEAFNHKKNPDSPLTPRHAVEILKAWIAFVKEGADSSQRGARRRALIRVLRHFGLRTVRVEEGQLVGIEGFIEDAEALLSLEESIEYSVRSWGWRWD